MKATRCLCVMGLMTVLSLLYVSQQTEVVKLGYQITAEEKRLVEAQDRRTSLEFTLSTIQSPVSIEENFMVPSGSFEMPHAFRLVKIEEPVDAAASAATAAASTPPKGWRRFALSALFSARSAEARTLK